MTARLGIDLGHFLVRYRVGTRDELVTALGMAVCGRRHTSAVIYGA
jgi:hypothetical protein